MIGARDKFILSKGHGCLAQYVILADKGFFDEKELQNQLVAAYLPGTRVDLKEFKTIHALKKPEDTKGYLSWNTFRMKKEPKKGLFGYPPSIMSLEK